MKFEFTDEQLTEATRLCKLLEQGANKHADILRLPLRELPIPGQQLSIATYICEPFFTGGLIPQFSPTEWPLPVWANHHVVTFNCSVDLLIEFSYVLRFNHSIVFDPKIDGANWIMRAVPNSGFVIGAATLCYQLAFNAIADSIQFYSFGFLNVPIYCHVQSSKL